MIGAPPDLRERVGGQKSEQENGIDKIFHGISLSKIGRFGHAHFAPGCDGGACKISWRSH